MDWHDCTEKARTMAKETKKMVWFEFNGITVKVNENTDVSHLWRDYLNANLMETKTIGKSVVISAKLPLSDLIRDFDDQLKSVSAGYASLHYEISEYKKTSYSHP